MTTNADRRGDITVAAAFVGILALTVVPLPPMLLDLLLAASMCLAALTFLVTFYVQSPLEFSAFPSLLLFVTLFRLALNVATTRLILTHGASGDHAAGGLIAAFGDFAIGGNFVVGAIIFLILVIVNFVVITKGAERISEVAARFTLDSMPGKQMAIDADLGAGLITEKDARARRKVVEQEASFHGSMDGASKFVRGDAVAGLMIVGINIVGGMIIGVAQQGLSAGEAATRYTTLSIGDGLVTQIPALLVSTGAALLTTRGGGGALGGALGSQLLSRRRPLAITAAVLAMVGLVPGMPHIVFLSLAFLAAWGAKVAGRNEAKNAAAGGPGASAEDQARPGAQPARDDATQQRAEIEAALPVELLSLDVGLDLLSMVDASRGGELLRRIASLRKQLASDLGLIVPPVHVRDDLRMRPGAYRIVVSGVVAAEGEVQASRLLAIDATGTATRGIPGDVVTEPTFGLPAKWMASSERARAEAAGCTVVDAAAVIATHLTEVIRRHAHEMLGRREAQELLDVAAKQDAKVVEELIPHIMSLGDVIKVLRNLLREGVSIRDMRTILESLADSGGAVKDPGDLTELVRQRLSRRLSKANLAGDGVLRAIVLDPRAEALFRDQSGKHARALSRLAQDIEAASRVAVERDEPALLVVAPDIRRAAAGLAGRHIPGLTVMSYREVDPAVPFVTRSVISAQENA